MKILFITGGSPWPPDIGVNQRTFFLHKALSECGKVDLIINSQYVSFNNKEMDMMNKNYGLIYCANPKKYNLLHKKKLKYFYNPHYFYKKKIDDLFGYYIKTKKDSDVVDKAISINQYNIVVSRYLRSAVNTGAIKYSPCVLDVDDLVSDAVKAGYKKIEKNYVKKKLWPLYYNIISRMEHYFLKKFDYLWFVKESDQNAFENIKSCILPNIPFIKEKERNSSNFQINGNLALFVGSMKHTVNVDGINRFIIKVWPQIRVSKPDAALRIVGTGMTEEQKNKWNQADGVEAVGYVDDLVPEYEKCAFTIVPLQFGGGSKIKLVESLSYGKTCVAYSHCMNGYEKVLKDGEDIYIAETDEKFIERCIELYEDTRKRNTMGQNGKKKVDTHFTFPIFLQIVQKTISLFAKEKQFVKARGLR